MIYNKYKETLDLLAIEDVNEKQVNDIIEKMAEDEDLTTDEYIELYGLAIDIIKYEGGLSCLDAANVEDCLMSARLK